MENAVYCLQATEYSETNFGTRLKTRFGIFSRDNHFFKFGGIWKFIFILNTWLYYGLDTPSNNLKEKVSNV